MMYVSKALLALRVKSVLCWPDVRWPSTTILIFAGAIGFFRVPRVSRRAGKLSESSRRFLVESQQGAPAIAFFYTHGTRPPLGFLLLRLLSAPPYLVGSLLP